MPDRKKISLVFHTVRYMTLRQWLYRLIFAAKKLLPAEKLRLSDTAEASPIPGAYAHAQPADLKAADALLNNTFPTVSGNTALFEEKIDWDLKKENYRLACFRLNSFSFLLTLSDAYRQTGNKAYLDKGFSLINKWQQDCQDLRGDKWNAYVLAQRLMHQMGFLSQYAGDALSQYVPFLAAQARVLSKNVEYHLGANHILSEAKSLMFCGSFLKDEKLYRQGKGILLSQLDVQFLPDGGHYERSVSYHVEALQQYWEALWLMRRQGDADAASLTQKLQQPYCFLNAMLRCDGSIPLVNDAAADYPCQAADFLYTSAYLFDTPAPRAHPGPYSRRWVLEANKLPISWEEASLFPNTGFLSHHFFHGSCNQSLFFDAGNHGPDCNLGHAHADALSILWTTEQGEIFADSGVFTYAPGKDRDACRATAAHNTVEIDGQSSCEIWAAFRAARRGHTVIEEYSDSKDFLLLTASHDGYRKVLSHPVTHRRSLRLCKSTGQLTVTDLLLPGKHVHEGALRFHLAPDCSAERLDAHTVLLRGKYRLRCSEELTLEPCRIATEFGRITDSLCLTARFPITGQTAVTTCIWEDPA